jgi:hypothetical protein
MDTRAPRAPKAIADGIDPADAKYPSSGGELKAYFGRSEEAGKVSMIAADLLVIVTKGD